MTFLIPDDPASEDLYNDAVQAALDLQAGKISQEGHDHIVSLYEAAERAHWSAAWAAA